MAKANKGGRKVMRGRIRRPKAAFQMARTAKNKHAAAARRTRRKDYWQSEEGQQRKSDKAKVRRMRKTMKKEMNAAPQRGHADGPEIPVLTEIPVLKLAAGTLSGSYAGDVYVSGIANEVLS